MYFYNIFMKITNWVITVVLLCFLGSCATFKDSAKYKFNDGIYYTHFPAGDKVYVSVINDDSIEVCPASGTKECIVLDVAKKTYYTSSGFSKKFNGKELTRRFYKPSLDVDVLTIPFKYRPYTVGFPNQFSASFNGALYGGYRTDLYKITYKRTPLNTYKQHIDHFAFGTGIVLGLGSTPVNEWNTRPPIKIEYEGVDLITGLALITAYQNLNFGLVFGIDHLLDQNRKYWIYEGKFSLGFSVGLNLN